MNNIFTYQRLHLKRYIRAVPFALLIISIICAVLYFFAGSLVKEKLSGENYTKFVIGIVGDTDDSFLGWGIDAIKAFDSSRFSIDFQNMTEDDASSALKSGSIYAYVRIPDNFVTNASKGDIQNVDYVTEASASGLSYIVKNEVLNMISEMIRYTEKGIYGTYFALDENNVSDADNIVNNLALRYLGTIMNRSSIYETEFLGISDDLPYVSYYICGFFTLFLSISGIGLCSLFSRDDTAFCRMIYAKGLNALSQTAAEFSAYLITLLMTVMPVIITASIILHAGGISAEFSALSVSELISFIAASAFCTFCLGALQFLIYEAVSGITNQIIIQFLGSIGLCYICGCFYPINFFPESVQVISSILPVGIVREFLSSCLSESSISFGLFGILLYTAIFIFICAIVRKGRITGLYGDKK